MPKRPYELPRAEYGVWQEVGDRCGAKMQAIVATVLGHENEQRNLTAANLEPSWDTLIRQIGLRRGVVFS